MAYGSFGQILNDDRDFVGRGIAAVVFDRELDFENSDFEILCRNRVFEGCFGDLCNDFSVDGQRDFSDRAVAVGSRAFYDEIFIQIENRSVLRGSYRTFGRV